MSKVRKAYTFYKTLTDLAGSESLLSESQPGYVKGNLVSISNSDEKVLGFFEIASVSTKRIFFNYMDFGFSKPEYFIPCESVVLQASTYFKNVLEVQNFEIYDYLTSGGPIPSYIVYNNICTGCNSPGASKIKPTFWED